MTIMAKNVSFSSSKLDINRDGHVSSCEFLDMVVEQMQARGHFLSVDENFQSSGYDLKSSKGFVDFLNSNKNICRNAFNLDKITGRDLCVKEIMCKTSGCIVMSTGDILEIFNKISNNIKRKISYYEIYENCGSLNTNGVVASSGKIPNYVWDQYFNKA